MSRETINLIPVAGTQRVYVEEGGDVVAIVEALANPHLRGAIVTLKAGRSTDIAAAGYALIGHGLAVLVQSKRIDEGEACAVQEMVEELADIRIPRDDGDHDVPF